MKLSTITLDNSDTCPKHDEETVKEYSFGYGDATVVKYECGCCLAYKEDGFLGGELFGNYNDAAAYAVLTKMQCAIDNKPFC